MVACSFDVEQFKPRCRLGKKRCFSRHARSLRKAQAAGNLRRDCQEELIDQICGKRLAEDKRPSFMQQEAYREFIGENFQDRRRRRRARLAGRAHGDRRYIAIVRGEPGRSCICCHDCGWQAIGMEGGLVQIYPAGSSDDNVEWQRRLTQSPAKLRVKLPRLRINECGNADMTGIVMQCAGAHEHSIGDAAQQSHHEAILIAAAADRPTTGAAWNAVGHNAINCLDEVGNDLRTAERWCGKRKSAAIEPRKLGSEELLVWFLPFVECIDLHAISRQANND